jgi:hypothetical protein
MGVYKEDPDWPDDLLYHYLCDPKYQHVNSDGWIQKWFDKWYEDVYSDALDDPGKIYELLLDTKSKDTNPKNKKQWAASRIPWNQLNEKWVKHCKGRVSGPPELACGAAVKVFFWKYMKWAEFPETVLPQKILRTDDERTRAVKTRRVSDARERIAKILKGGTPIRARFDGQAHKMGIVGCNAAKDKFLCIQPWPKDENKTYSYPEGKRKPILFSYEGKPAGFTRFLVCVTLNPTTQTLEYPAGSPGGHRTMSAFGNPKER